jgi:hypothetical protein
MWGLLRPPSSPRAMTVFHIHYKDYETHHANVSGVTTSATFLLLKQFPSRSLKLPEFLDSRYTKRVRIFTYDSFVAPHPGRGNLSLPETNDCRLAADWPAVLHWLISVGHSSLRSTELEPFLITGLFS